MRIAFLFFASVAIADYQRMTVSFTYKGEPMKATFFTTVRSAAETEAEATERLHTADYLDGLRFQNYVAKSSMSEWEKADLRNNFFKWEPLRRHDEIMILHRGELGDQAAGLGTDILGMIAIDRLGDTTLDSLPGYDLDAFETFLLEKRLAPLGIKVPRPEPFFWSGDRLPPGVYKHWDSVIGNEYFQSGRIVLGDVIQANALFAHEGTWPLIHSLANAYGLFSTGRIIPAGKKKIIGDMEYEGPWVFVPTLVVWEVFNKEEEGVVKKGSRTHYYERSGGRTLWIGGQDQWEDPRLLYGNHVQIMSKSGDGFRFGWTKQFAEKENFSFVRDVVIEKTVLETMDGGGLIGKLMPVFAEAIQHHPKNLSTCARVALAAENRAVTSVTIPVQIKVGIGNLENAVQRSFNIRRAFER